MKKKERGKTKGKGEHDEASTKDGPGPTEGGPLKKRRLLGGDGKEIVFSLPGDRDDDESDAELEPAHTAQIRYRESEEA